MRFVIAFLFWALLPVCALAQSAATLVADNVQLSADGVLVATGNVEALYDGNRLTASRILYDQSTDRLEITGPIIIQTADGTILTASRAELDPRLENGILQSARIVLDQQLQLVANQIDRQDGRYSQLYKTAATSCHVCGNRPPLWEIRAERVIHDEVERQLYFQNATFRIRGVPVLWVPRMRLPDPTLSRATGLLVPEQRNTTLLGYGIKLPYFITLGDSRDLTLTPYVSAETRTLELRYRQAFRNGSVIARGAVSSDTLVDDTRAYFFANGSFDLARDFVLDFDIETASDPAYLTTYDYSDKDRLDSAVSLTRVDDDRWFRGRLTYFETLREDEENASLPPVVADLSYAGRLDGYAGGSLVFDAGLDAAYRTSDVPGDAGRDLLRAGGYAGWQRTMIGAYGTVANVEAGARLDAFAVSDDPAYDEAILRVVPTLNATLRWPLTRTYRSGTTHIIEPAVQLGWAQSYGGTPPNEDSTRTELDRANLFAVSRFAGEDAVQEDWQIAAGLTWSRFGGEGWDSALTFGRVLRQTPNDGFTRSSGLDGARSDWLVAGQITAPGGFLFDGRSLWDAEAGLTVADSRISWRNDWISLGANYIWQSGDPDEGRDDVISEWTVDSTFEISAAWSLAVDGRYDIAADRPVSAGVGLTWRNECVTIDVSASRRYASSDTVEPTTAFGISGTIDGFSTGRAAGGLTTGCGNGNR